METSLNDLIREREAISAGLSYDFRAGNMIDDAKLDRLADVLRQIEDWGSVTGQQYRII